MMNRVVFICLISFIFGCNESTTKVESSKLNKEYFIGEYKTDFRGEIEKITIKGNGYYDYSYGQNNDTIIKDAGKWSFYKDEVIPSISVYNFPLLRKKSIFNAVGKKSEINFHVDTSLLYFGDLDLYTNIGADDFHYIFVKLDKSKNKDYIIKK